MSVRAFRFLFAIVVFAFPVHAAPQLKSETDIERQVRQISERLRCPVCQSENLYDSKAPLANEMRSIIREKLSEGETGDQIVAFFVDRYGGFVLQEPPKSGSLLLIWILPFLIVAIASLALAWRLRRAEVQEDSDFDSPGDAAAKESAS